MKRRLIILATLFLSVVANAQVMIDLDLLERSGSTTMEMILQDSKTKEPLPYVTVYLIPQGDTTITHFALSDQQGKVRIEEILSGKYSVNAELIGYKPYIKEHELYGYSNVLGVILLEEDPEYIDAATITALANPISIKKDTIEYNANAFHVGENAMLEDLLKKMPGMEVADDGTVKVNGEAVDKITVGGKTFFFNDPAMAVKNLPAKVVDKIKVIDKDSDEAEFSGIGTETEKEKVMDVQLKEEYKEGWFGNLKLNGGSTLGGDSENEMLDDIGPLFNSNAMVAGYNEKDQVTFLGNARNAMPPGTAVAILVNDDYYSDELASKDGQITSAQAGVNYNTQRIKGMDFNTSLSYTYQDKDSREKSSRTSFQADGSRILTDRNFNGYGTDHKINSSWELEKQDNSKYMFAFRPSFTYTSRNRSMLNGSTTTMPGSEGNISSSESVSHSDILNTSISLNAGIKDMGRAGRSLMYRGGYTLRNVLGNSLENSTTRYGDVSDIRNLNYDQRENRLSISNYLDWVEPLSECWSVKTTAGVDYAKDSNTKDAFNGLDGSANDYYSSWSVNTDLTFNQRILAQYKKDEHTLSLGASLFEENNVINSRTIGIESLVGEDEWIFNWSPYVEYDWSKGYDTFIVSYQGYTDTPSGTSIIPALNISNPVLVSTGNIYLRPSFQQMAMIYFMGMKPENMLTYQFSLAYGLMNNAQTTASWYDGNGIRYSIPVNSLKPEMSLSSYGVISTPLDKERRWNITFQPVLTFDNYVNYQAKDRLEGFDKEHFDYTAMMSSFWGDASGNKFYSGESGFEESLTRTLNASASLSAQYRGDHITVSTGGYVSNQSSKYTLDPTADVNTWRFRFDADLLYKTKNGFELGTDASYTFYRGFTYGYGEPSLIWNAKASRNVKSLTFTLSCADILNQSRSLRRTASAEYIEDVYSNVMGRFIMLGVAFNFGKMNARNSAAAQNAMSGLMY